MPKTKSKSHKQNKTRKNRDIDKMNCSPAVKTRRVSTKTCYTSESLATIKDHYNQNHDSIDEITATNPLEIWKELRKRLKSKCKKEDCWLEEIRDPKLRQSIDYITFAPDTPSDWDEDPYGWLSNEDIAFVLKQYEISHPQFKLLGPTPIDYDARVPEEGGQCVWEDLCHLNLQELRDQGKTKLGVVFNLDKHDGDGIHWTSMFIDLEYKIIYYYDSARFPFPRQVAKLRDEIVKQGRSMTPPIRFKFVRNPKTHQRSSSECGMFCLFFIITFLIGETEFKKNMSIQEKLDLFCNKQIPDHLMRKYRSIYFNQRDRNQTENNNDE
jgi:hypothetical protein